MNTSAREPIGWCSGRIGPLSDLTIPIADFLLAMACTRQSASSMDDRLNLIATFAVWGMPAMPLGSISRQSFTAQSMR